MKLKPCPFCGGKAIDKAIIHSYECFIHKLLYRHDAREIEDAWQIRATDPLMEGMAGALDYIARKAESYQIRTGKEISWLSMAKQALQKYREQEATNAKT